MKQSKKAGVVGACIALSYFIFNVYHAIRISEGFTFSESLLPELEIAFSVLLPLIAPAILLLLIKRFKKEAAWIFWIYPIIIGLGLLNVVLANDPLAAGLTLIVIVIPFCVIYTIVLLCLIKKKA